MKLWISVAGLLSTVLSTVTFAGTSGTWSEAHPWRREALIQGRDFDYNSESFLHRFSYEHLSSHPRSDQDGVRGTAGSVTGDELFVDIALQKTLVFDDQRHSLFLRMQRFEDFDGEFDRQLVGITRRLGDDWRIALAGDVQGSKAETDIQLQARWRPDNQRQLRLAVIYPDYFYNEKSGADGEYQERPQTWFIHYRQQTDNGWGGEFSLNFSPEARFKDSNRGVDARGDQTRLMASITVPYNAWRATFKVQAETVDRDFIFYNNPAPTDDFSRNMHSATVYVQAPHWRYAPQWGIHHLRLKENGWFGSAREFSGRVQRQETYLFAGLTLKTGNRQQWQPTIFIGQADTLRTSIDQPGLNRDSDRWIGKLALPWRYIVNAERGAILTLNPTFRLHTAAFGGGNIQLHWPL